ncbi:MAG: carbon-nitrogen hydrolase family protein, partial [Actinobacteria bacterium]|nr:carbon-nitrogen hydrolase family protein [Actinomycetota bacterium]
MKIKIAVCQLRIVNDKARNLDNASDMIKKASIEKPDIIILPEMFNCPYNPAYFEKFSETYPGVTSSFLSGLSQKYGTYIVGGSIPEKEDGLIYNTSYVFDPSGSLAARHRKIHLFD